MNVLNGIFYFVSFIPLIALPFLFENWARYMKARADNRSKLVPVPNKMPVKSVLFFVAPVSTGGSVFRN